MESSWPSRLPDQQILLEPAMASCSTGSRNTDQFDCKKGLHKIIFIMKNILSCFTITLFVALGACNSAKHATQSAPAYGAPYLPFIDPGRYDTAWWKRAPYRLVQSNLREIDATMDVDAYVQSMVDASANVVLINV